jgi:hypothetical protein
MIPSPSTTPCCRWTTSARLATWTDTAGCNCLIAATVRYFGIGPTRAHAVGLVHTTAVAVTQVRRPSASWRWRPVSRAASTRSVPLTTSTVRSESSTANGTPSSKPRRSPSGSGPAMDWSRPSTPTFFVGQGAKVADRPAPLLC